MCRLVNRAFDATVCNATQASVNQFQIPSIRIRFDYRQYLEAEGAIREKAEEREWNGTERNPDLRSFHWFQTQTTLC